MHEIKTQWAFNRIFMGINPFGADIALIILSSHLDLTAESLLWSGPPPNSQQPSYSMYLEKQSFVVLLYMFVTY